MFDPRVVMALEMQARELDRMLEPPPKKYSVFEYYGDTGVSETENPIEARKAYVGALDSKHPLLGPKSELVITRDGKNISFDELEKDAEGYK